jgi:FkbM family methyltransferase
MSGIKSFPAKIKSRIHALTSPGPALSWRQRREIARLLRMPRYVETTTSLLGYTANIPDGPSFISIWREIFLNSVYKFCANSQSPRILDCGANIGLSCVYFKTLFPCSRITAFEPDPKIFIYLKNILAGARLHDIELIPKAVWSSATTLQFSSEGADAGRVATASVSRTIEIGTVRLRDYLSEPIDFLKIDVEGSETEVLVDCAQHLANVRHVFVEYHSFAGQTQTIGKLLAVLTDAGFRMHIHPELTSASPFVAVNQYHGMDLQLNIFAYRDRL